MAARHPVAGHVKDASGAPCKGALITIVSGTAPVPEITRVADDAGAFRLSLPGGTYTLEAVSPDGSRAAQQAVTVPGTVTVEIVLPA